jgi:hypothetical protein
VCILAISTSGAPARVQRRPAKPAHAKWSLPLQFMLNCRLTRAGHRTELQILSPQDVLERNHSLRQSSVGSGLRANRNSVPA